MPAATSHEPLRHIVVMGVSGSGKSLVGELLTARLGWPFCEADEAHPPANVAKMASGQPLSDEDRFPWLRTIRDWMSARQREGDSTVVTCSALRRSYRDVLRQATGEVVFVHLHGKRWLLEQRLSGREGHFMPVELLDSQLATLESLEADEVGIVLDVTATPEDLVEQTLQAFGPRR